MNLKEQLHRMLETSSGSPLDVCLVLYTEFLSKSEKPGELLQIILESTSYKGNVSDSSSMYISDDDISDYLFTNFDLISAIIRSIASQNLHVESFYEKLYSNLFEWDLLPHQNKDQAILLYILASQKIPELPYHYADNLLIMSDEEYTNIIDSIEPQISLAVYMLNRRFKSKTEEISQLWNIASNLSSREQQIVFWAVMIGVIRRYENNLSQPPNA